VGADALGVIVEAIGMAERIAFHAEGGGAVRDHADGPRAGGGLRVKGVRGEGLVAGGEGLKGSPGGGRRRRARKGGACRRELEKMVQVSRSGSRRISDLSMGCSCKLFFERVRRFLVRGEDEDNLIRAGEIILAEWAELEAEECLQWARGR